MLVVFQMFLKRRQIWQWHTLKKKLNSSFSSYSLFENYCEKSSKAIFQCIFDLECAITISFAKTRFSKRTSSLQICIHSIHRK